MQDKYSKLEGKIEEEIRRREEISEIFKSFFDENVLKLLNWKIISVKKNKNNQRVNVVEIICKKSAARFIFNQKQEELKKLFENEFKDNLGNSEKIVFRVK